MSTEEQLSLGAINTKVARFKLLIESANEGVSINIP